MVCGYPKLKEIIKNRNVEQEICELIDISVFRLKNILSGKKNEDFFHDEAIAICRFLEVLPNDVFMDKVK